MKKKDPRGRKKVIYDPIMQEKMREALIICYDNIQDIDFQLWIEKPYINAMINKHKPIPEKYHYLIFKKTNEVMERIEKISENLLFKTPETIILTNK